MTVIQQMVEYLRELEDGAVPDIAGNGLCHAVTVKFRDTLGTTLIDQLLEESFETWDEGTDDLQFPVPHPEIDCSEAAYYSVLNLWVGEYGAARRRLCGYVANELQARYL